jgi:hypothetical protein
MEINSDSRHLVEKSVKEFQKSHHCQPAESENPEC